MAATFGRSFVNKRGSMYRIGNPYRALAVGTKAPTSAPELRPLWVHGLVDRRAKFLAYVDRVEKLQSPDEVLNELHATATRRLPRIAKRERHQRDTNPYILERLPQ
jgi:hypothetical protein